MTARSAGRILHGGSHARGWLAGIIHHRDTETTEKCNGGNDLGRFHAIEYEVFYLLLPCSVPSVTLWLVLFRVDRPGQNPISTPMNSPLAKKLCGVRFVGNVGPE